MAANCAGVGKQPGGGGGIITAPEVVVRSSARESTLITCEAAAPADVLGPTKP